MLLLSLKTKRQNSTKNNLFKKSHNKYWIQNIRKTNNSWWITYIHNRTYILVSSINMSQICHLK